MAASPSPSPGPAILWAVWLYHRDANGKPVRDFLVDLPVPLPQAVTYLGGTYTFDDRNFGYTLTTPFAATGDTGRPLLSQAAFPQGSHF